MGAIPQELGGGLEKPVVGKEKSPYLREKEFFGKEFRKEWLEHWKGAR